MRRRIGLVALDELVEVVGLAKKSPKIFFFAKSLTLAKWTYLPNMMSLAQWEQVSHDYSYSYTLKIKTSELARLRDIEKHHSISLYRRKNYPSLTVPGSQ